MADKSANNTSLKNLDFLTKTLLEGQELEISFSSYKSKNFIVSGNLKIKEQDIWVKPKRGIINSPKTEAWMCSHPHY